MQLKHKNETELVDFAAKVAKSIPNGALIFLYGPLGAGKTTFARGFLHSLGVNSKVKSPTYTLVEPYEVNDRYIYHFDLYRLTDPHELLQLGFEEYCTENAICLIEWPEKGFPLLPQPDLACYIEIEDKGRSLRLEALSPQGVCILGRIK